MKMNERKILKKIKKKMVESMIRTKEGMEAKKKQRRTKFKKLLYLIMPWYTSTQGQGHPITRFH